jgi:cysteine desulfurase family protein (TIGR01976 family)
MEMMVPDLDLGLVRSYFPALGGEWVFFDNAGGTQTAVHVGRRLHEYLYESNVQHGASYAVSALAVQRVREARDSLTEFIHAADVGEVILGPSTTQLLQNLAKSLVQLFKPGDEVIVTNCDHEANIGPWVSMQRQGIRVKEWKIRPDTLRLELDDLAELMTEKTRLVAFTHVSNILGTINPVREICAFIHEHGAMACVDGVAAAPHRLPDVRQMDADFYVFSLYKVFGPHYSLLYAKKPILTELPGINHYFISPDDIPYKLQPGNVNFELAYSLLGVTDYFREIARGHNGALTGGPRAALIRTYEQIATHEARIGAILVDFLRSKKNIRIIGEPNSDSMVRVPTFSFIAEKSRSDEVVSQVDGHRIGIRYGDFYARRLIESLGLAPKNGVIRVSMVHYNTRAEVERLVKVLDGII